MLVFGGLLCIGSIRWVDVLIGVGVMMDGGV